LVSAISVATCSYTSDTDNAYIAALENFSINDVDELQKILTQIKSAKLKQLIERDVVLARSKLVTRLVNDSIAKKSGKTRKKETRVIEEEVEVEVEDVDGWIEANVKGFKEKARSIKNTLPDTSYNSIKDALIRCKGDEGRALEGLLSSSLPPRPNIGKTKIKKKIQKTQVVYVDVGSNESNGNEEQFLLDVTLEENNNTELLNERVKTLKKKIEEEKEATQKLIKDIEKHKKTSTDYRSLQNLIGGDDDGMKTNRMFLPGEYDAIENNECRLFTFKPERTFSNEVSHIHFRVAESEFHRLLQVKNAYRVIEVKYIVTPYLIRKFEQRRSQMAFAMGKKYRDVKPILAFHGVPDGDEIDWIILNNIRNVETEGAYFYSDHTYAQKFIQGEGGRIMLFLVLTGRATQVNDGTLKSSDMHQRQIDDLKKTMKGDCLESRGGKEHMVFDSDLIIPYYVVKYEKPTQVNNVNQQNPHGIKRLDEEWKNIEIDAKADKFMDDCKKFYQQTLVTKDTEHKMGAIDPSQQWFNTQYAKKYEQEKKFAGDEFSPITPQSVDFELDYGSGSEDVVDEQSEEVQDVDDVDEDVEDVEDE
jgi:hypothetical protein